MTRIAYPLYLKPLLMERVWGGNRLERLYGKMIPYKQIIGESWELSDRADAQSIVVNGPLNGLTLRQVMELHSVDLLGPALAAARPKWFPLLVKYVDAGEPLSVQVHPDDEGAKAFNDRGKSECWVVVHADPGARIVRGLRPGIARPEYEAAVAAGHVEDILKSFTPKVGDVLALPPGMVHAIGAGLVVAEIQQNSDLTFRIYDYNRMGLDGRPRKLHVNEALSAIRFKHTGDEFAGNMTTDTVTPLSRETTDTLTIEHLLDGRFFSLIRHSATPSSRYILPASPHAPRVLMVISGNGELGGFVIKSGQTLLLPADLPDTEVRSHHKGLELLLSAPTVAAC